MNEQTDGSKNIDVILPVYNEEKTIRPVVEEIFTVHSDHPFNIRVICVDDGSRDKSSDIIRDLSDEYSTVHGVFFKSNCGQSAAFKAGFEYADAPFVVTMDADGQNDPADISVLIEHLKDVDVVAGYRADRQDSMAKKVGSWIGNSVRNWVTGDSIIDTGCSLKLFRKEVVKSVPMFEGMHRFLPTLARMQGYRVTQVPVNHRPRQAGKTKYSNFGRLTTTIWDLFAVRWMQKRHIEYEVEETTNS